MACPADCCLSSAVLCIYSVRWKRSWILMLGSRDAVDGRLKIFALTSFPSTRDTHTHTHSHAVLVRPRFTSAASCPSCTELQVCCVCVFLPFAHKFPQIFPSPSPCSAESHFSFPHSDLIVFSLPEQEIKRRRYIKLLRTFASLFHRPVPLR